MTTRNPPKSQTTASRANWKQIRGVRVIAESNIFLLDSNILWLLVEVKSARASEELCSAFGARSWCIKEASCAKDYLPLYFFVQVKGSHQSLMACYSDRDKVLSDRANKDMSETNIDCYFGLTRFLLSHRPKKFIWASIVKKVARDLERVVPRLTVNNLRSKSRASIRASVLEYLEASMPRL